MRAARVGSPFLPNQLLIVAFAFVLTSVPPSNEKASAQDLPTIGAMTAHMESQDGFIPIHYDGQTGKLYLEVSLPSEEFLYNSLMASDAGLAFSPGSPNWVACEKILRFERRGDQATLVRVDLGAQERIPEDPDLAALLEALLGDFLGIPFPIVAEEEGRFLVEGTEHFIRNLYDVPERFASLFNDESFLLDPDQSSIYRPKTRATSVSTEIEVSFTFVSDHPGEVISRFLPDPTSFVARERHSLLKLPSPGLERRPTDPRMGFMGPIVPRRRLEKGDPSSQRSKVVDPIVFHVDAAMPARIREATEHGLDYWSSVFANLGFQDAIEVRDLPFEADPLDPRFPIVVLWRPAGMSSQGFPLLDPRTGEIVKAVITLGGQGEKLHVNSYRAYQPALEPGQPDLEAIQMARQAWTVAHEAGHVLAGLAHNDIVPSMIGFLRPRLRVSPSGGLQMDLSVVSPPEPLPYDEWMMRYAYASFEPEEVEDGLREIVEEGLGRRLKFADNDARSSNPRATGRIHCDDPLTVLEEDMAVRRVLIGRFGADVLQAGEPDLLLFERLIPAYFHHRHSLKAVATMLGGVDFTYHPAGDFLRVETVIDSRDQRRALDAILAALSPDELAIPPRVAEIVPARLESSPVSELEWPVREPGVFLYITNTAPLPLPLPAAGPFDPLGWARVLADLVVSDLLDPERLTRVAAHHASGRSDLPVEQVLNRIVQGTWGAFWPEDPTLAPLRRIAREAVLDRLLDGARAEEPHMELREPFLAILEGLLDNLRRHETADPAERAHLDEAISRIGEMV